ncbi:MAG: hypothetical protein KDI74_15825 [Gammaproteobacteria bacterium]|nr:hypothetical protein [Gammaproteobacteria bacterium]
MEKFQGSFKAVNIVALVISRIVRSTEIHCYDGVQRIKPSRDQEQFPLEYLLVRKLALRSKEMAIMGRFLRMPQVPIPEEVFKVVRCKANHVLNTVRYRSLGRFAALRAG